MESFILFWASQCSMSLAGTPSMARMTSPGHKLAMEALLPGVIWKGDEQMSISHLISNSWEVLYGRVSC